MPIIPEIDDILNQYILPDAPGAALAIIDPNGTVIHKTGYGLANLEWGISVTPDTIFRVASITKQFTATAIMLLVQEGKLDLHAPITDYLHDYPTAGHYLSTHHLLTHTAGIHPQQLPENEFYHSDVTTQQMVDYFSQRPFMFKPGTKYRYTTPNYILLGAIIEAITNQLYTDFMQEHIFTPLGMTTTGLFHHKPIMRHRATGYKQTPQGFVNASFLNVTIAHAGGGFGGSLEDLILWDRSWRENTLLTPDTQDLMHTRATLEDGTQLNYGYGWQITDYYDYNIVEHSGLTAGGFSTRFTTFPDVGLSVILLTNRYALNTQQIVAAIARYMLNITPPKHRPYFLTSDSLKKCIGEYETPLGKVRMAVEQDKLILHCVAASYRLLPVSKSTFFVPDDPDVMVVFEDEQDGVFQRLILQEPFTSQSAKRVSTIGYPF